MTRHGLLLTLFVLILAAAMLTALGVEIHGLANDFSHRLHAVDFGGAQ